MEENEVIAALRAKAEMGGVPAARELREWLTREAASHRTDDEIWELLTPEQRETVRGWLLEIREEPSTRCVVLGGRAPTIPAATPLVRGRGEGHGGVIVGSRLC